MCGGALALDYEPWRARGIKRTPSYPKLRHRIRQPATAVDSAVNAQCVVMGKGLWCNRRLMDEVDRGRVTLVFARATTEEAPQRTISPFSVARKRWTRGFVATTFRDHRRRTGSVSARQALKEFGDSDAWTTTVVTPGLDDDVLTAMSARDWSPTVGASFFPESPVPAAAPSAAGRPTPYHAMPHDVLPIYFEPPPRTR